MHKCFLTFRGPCIVKYSNNKSQRDALFLKFILIKYMLQTDLLSIFRSLKTVYTAIIICHASYFDCLLARSGPLTWQIPTAVYTALRLLMMDSRSVWNMYFIKINLRNSASRWILLQECKSACHEGLRVGSALDAGEWLESCCRCPSPHKRA